VVKNWFLQKKIYFTLGNCIIIHNKFGQFERLLRSIYQPQNVYCIHVDGKYPDLIESVKVLTKCFPNVFITKSVNVTYGGFSRVQEND